MTINIGIIGCGLIGEKRFKNVGTQGKILAVSDKDIKSAKKLVKNKKIKIFKNWKKLIEMKELEAIIIATYHNQLSKILIECLKNNKHALVEKPGAIDPNQLKEAFKIAKVKKLYVMK